VQAKCLTGRRVLAGVELDVGPLLADGGLEGLHGLGRPVGAAQPVAALLGQEADDADVLEGLEHGLAGERALEEPARDDTSVLEGVVDVVVGVLGVVRSSGSRLRLRSSSANDESTVVVMVVLLE